MIRFINGYFVVGAPSNAISLTPTRTSGLSVNGLTDPFFVERVAGVSSLSLTTTATINNSRILFSSTLLPTTIQDDPEIPFSVDNNGVLRLKRNLSNIASIILRYCFRGSFQTTFTAINVGLSFLPSSSGGNDSSHRITKISGTTQYTLSYPGGTITTLASGTWYELDIRYRVSSYDSAQDRYNFWVKTTLYQLSGSWTRTTTTVNNIESMINNIPTDQIALTLWVPSLDTGFGSTNTLHIDYIRIAGSTSTLLY